jgi:adenosylhomocysteine nucleosidase
MTVLTLVPTTRELDALVAAFKDMDVAGKPITIGRLDAISYLGGRALVAEGGLGKAQFAVQTQHSVEAIPDLSVALCLGSAGGLNSELNIGDVVVATETIEHDFNRGLIPGPLPEFEGDARFISAVRASRSFDELPFAVKFGRVASGDEAIITTTRAAEVTNATGAIAVAWEGAGGARACRFAEVPFVEVRGISDMANEEAESVFFENIPATMKNLAIFLNEFVTLMSSS